ncbi:type II secretion system protein [Pelagicoccus mobilis]|nr:type II secretion system protein [Pelagicoccus mobilis]
MRHGFTLVELMIVVVLVGLLASIAIPTISKVRENALKSRLAHDFKTFRTAFEQYALENGDWPRECESGCVS